MLVAAGAVAAAVCAIEVAGALSTGGNTEKLDRPAESGIAQAVGELLTFGHGNDTVQLRLAAILLLGLVGAARLGGLRWLIGTAVLFGGLFVLTAAYTEPLARTIASIWWDDSWRLVGLAALPMAVIVGNGVAEVQRVAARGSSGAGGSWASPPPWPSCWCSCSAPASSTWTATSSG